MPPVPKRFRYRQTSAPGALVVLVLLAGTTVLTGCEALLGSTEEGNVDFIAPLWNVQTVIEGDIEGLDLKLLPDGDLIASYVLNGSILKISRYSGDSWTNMDGPAYGPIPSTNNEITTHLAVSPDGSASVLYGSETEALVLPVNSSPGVPFSVDTLPATLRPPTETGPTGFSVVSSSLAYGSDGRLRIMVRDANDARLWLFRQESDGWSLGPVPLSEGVLGPTQLAVWGTTNEHAVFQAGSQGYYFWWLPDDGWQERVRFIAGQPFLLRLRANQASVLTTRDKYILQVAEEQQDLQTGQYFWAVRTVTESSELYWHNYELVLDPDGYPTHAFILGPLRNETYEIWVTRLQLDGTWQEARVTANLSLPAFNPFNVRMVREPEGRYHMLLTTGETTSNLQGELQVDQRLLHLVSDSPFGR